MSTENVHRLIFGDPQPSRPNPMPTAEECAHAATWAADRGWLDVAAPLMDLARALWRHRIETPTVPVPVYDGPVRDERPAICRIMDTRTCPPAYRGPCGERPCARFESNDETPWRQSDDPRPFTITDPTS